LAESRAAESGRLEAVTRLAIDIGSSSLRAQPFDDRGDAGDELSEPHWRGSDQDELAELVRSLVDGRDAAPSTSCRIENIRSVVHMMPRAPVSARFARHDDR
jgi:hypothetical protein